MVLCCSDDSSEPHRERSQVRFPDSLGWWLSTAIVCGFPSILASKFKKSNLEMMELLWNMGISGDMKKCDLSFVL